MTDSDEQVLNFILVVLSIFAGINVLIWLVIFVQRLYDDFAYSRRTRIRRREEESRLEQENRERAEAFAKDAEKNWLITAEVPQTLADLRAYCEQMPGDGAAASIFFTKEGGYHVNDFYSAN